jgi:hypothetical protein
MAGGRGRAHLPPEVIGRRELDTDRSIYMTGARCFFCGICTGAAAVGSDRCVKISEKDERARLKV